MNPRCLPIPLVLSCSALAEPILTSQVIPTADAIILAKLGVEAGAVPDTGFADAQGKLVLRSVQSARVVSPGEVLGWGKSDYIAIAKFVPDVAQDLCSAITQDAVLPTEGSGNPAAIAWPEGLKGDRASVLTQSFGYGL